MPPPLQCRALTRLLLLPLLLLALDSTVPFTPSSGGSLTAGASNGTAAKAGLEMLWRSKAELVFDHQVLLAFLHIPKTGGTTLQSQIENILPLHSCKNPSFGCPSEVIRDSMHCVGVSVDARTMMVLLLLLLHGWQCISVMDVIR